MGSRKLFAWAGRSQPRISGVSHWLLANGNLQKHKNKFLQRCEENGSPILLVGMEISTATMKNSMAAPQKKKSQKWNRDTIQQAITR
jgi:hypothetical protein